jgi:hypothetical protein
MSRNIVKAANEVNVKRKIDLNGIKCPGCASMFVLTIGCFASVFAVSGGRSKHRIQGLGGLYSVGR